MEQNSCIFFLIFPFFPCKQFFSIRYLKFVNRESSLENYLSLFLVFCSSYFMKRLERQKQNRCKVAIKEEEHRCPRNIGHLRILEEKKYQFLILQIDEKNVFLVNEIFKEGNNNFLCISIQFSSFGQMVIFLPNSSRKLVDY